MTISLASCQDNFEIYIQSRNFDDIFYSKTNDSSLVVFIDSDWAGDMMQRKKHLWLYILFGIWCVFLVFKKQQVVALSATTPENMTATSNALYNQYG